MEAIRWVAEEKVKEDGEKRHKKCRMENEEC
jgi:hypothetical protein